jgi:SAM-dependent methyltransferase
MKYPMPTGLFMDGVSKNISPKCEMYRFAKNRLGSDSDATNYYFYSAHFLIERLIPYLESISFDRSKANILDFASGYGRFTRFFCRLSLRTMVSDLEPDMLSFLKDNLGTDGFLSTLDFFDRSVMNQEKFDLVFVFSLFTHLPDHIWSKALFKLLDYVDDGGFFVFSVREKELHEKITGNKLTGKYLYGPGNETSGRLSPEIYGTMTVSDQYVREKLGQRKDLEIVRHFKSGDCDLFHDIYVVKKS